MQGDSRAMTNRVTVNARKYDGSIRKSWQCDLLKSNADSLTLLGVFDQDIEHAGLGSIARGTRSYEYFWPDRWYNIFRFQERDGAFRNFYCNVAMPSTFDGAVIDYVDLDIDIIVGRDLAFEVVDRDDFEINSRRYNYTEEMKHQSENAVRELIAMIEKRQFPFDFDESKWRVGK